MVIVRLRIVQRGGAWTVWSPILSVANVTSASANARGVVNHLMGTGNYSAHRII